MKKIFLTMFVLTVITLTATAQDGNRRSAQISLAQKFVLVKYDKDDQKTWYAVMSFPVTYYNYYAVTGRNIRPQNKDINSVIMMGDNEKQKFAHAASNLFDGVTFRVASTTELHRALSKHFNIQSENGPYSCATNGFYLSCSYKTYKRMKKLINEYLSDKKSKQVKKTKQTKIRNGKGAARKSGGVG